MIEQNAGICITTPVLVFGQYRHESLRKSPLGKQAPQQVGNLESDKKRVGGDPGTKGACNNRVANETEDPRNQRHTAHRGKRLQQIHGVMPCLGWPR